MQSSSVQESLFISVIIELNEVMLKTNNKETPSKMYPTYLFSMG